MTIKGGNGANLSNGGFGTRGYVCGDLGCGRSVASQLGTFYTVAGKGTPAFIYICPLCQRPTFFDDSDNLKVQLPGVSIGNPVEHLPSDVDALYEEIREVTSSGAYTSAVLGCRKLLMHIAVEKKAPVGQSFVSYVEYLDANHYTPPGSAAWVDQIRQHGNEANHEIVMKAEAEAKQLIAFAELLLKFIYEFPGKLPPLPPKP